MILAAGRGERLRPLTDQTPKPLIKVADKCLIDYQIEALKRAGIDNIVVNVWWLGKQIQAHLQDGRRYGVTISYSEEYDGALETAGGILRALPKIKSDPFVVCNSDIWSDFDYTQLPLESLHLAHLVLVENPSHNTQGDFSLQGRWVTKLPHNALTFAGIGLYRKQLFEQLEQKKYPLSPLLEKALAQRQVSGQIHRGQWCDVGTEARLEALRQRQAQAITQCSAPDW